MSRGLFPQSLCPLAQQNLGIAAPDSDFNDSLALSSFANESKDSVRPLYVSGRFQKVGLAVIIGGCLFGIGFQHYVRGPRQRLARVVTAVSGSNWAEFVDCYPAAAWSNHAWSKGTMREFLTKYVEPQAGNRVEVGQLTERWFGNRFRRTTLYDKSEKCSLLELDQCEDTITVWSTSTSRFLIPVGWSEMLPTPVMMIRTLAKLWYPHPELSDSQVSERVSEYEFYMAEQDALRSIGVERIGPKSVFGVDWTVGNYMLNMRKLLPKLKADFDRIDLKYGPG